MTLVDQAARSAQAAPRRGRADPPLPRLHLPGRGQEREGRRGVPARARPEGARRRGRAGDDLLARADLHPAGSVPARARADRHLVPGRGRSQARRVLPEGDDPRPAGEVRRGARAREDGDRHDRRRRARAGCSCWSRSTASRRTTRTWRRRCSGWSRSRPANKQYWTQLAAVQNYLQRDPEALATLRLADVAELLSEDPDVRQLARLMFVRELPYQCARRDRAARSPPAS